MDMSSLSVFTLIRGKLQHSAQRQQVIADNIANADTPHYQAREIEAFDFKKALRQRMRLTPIATHSAHQAGLNGRLDGTGGMADPHAYETSPTGNSVVIEQQMVKLQENNAEYTMALNVYRKNKDMMRIAVRGR